MSKYNNENDFLYNLLFEEILITNIKHSLQNSKRKEIKTPIYFNKNNFLNLVRSHVTETNIDKLFNIFKKSTNQPKSIKISGTELFLVAKNTTELLITYDFEQIDFEHIEKRRIQKSVSNTNSI